MPALEIFTIFARLGLTTFGGPAAHIALFEDEFVRRRGWLTREEFLALNAAAQLIPGPNSTELAIHIGHKRGGWPGLLAAGAGFILPAALLTALVAWGYVRYGSLPAVLPALLGIKLAVLVIVARAAWTFGKTSLTSPLLQSIALFATAGVLVEWNEFLVLAGAGLIAWLARERPRGVAPALTSLPLLTSSPSLLTLFASFAQIGAVLFGSGYVLYAFLHAEFVTRLGWLTSDQVADAIAAGQITPGPLFSTATFVGYLVAGWTGAGVATAGIFLPAFTFVAISAPLLPLIERHPGFRAARDGVVAASLGLLAATTVFLAREAFNAPPVVGVVVLAGAAALLFRWKVNPAALVLWGAAVGYALG